MVNYTKGLGMKVNVKNGKQEMVIKTTMSSASYESIKDVLLAHLLEPLFYLQ